VGLAFSYCLSAVIAKLWWALPGFNRNPAARILPTTIAACHMSSLLGCAFLSALRAGLVIAALLVAASCASQPLADEGMGNIAWKAFPAQLELDEAAIHLAYPDRPDNWPLHGTVNVSSHTRHIGELDAQFLGELLRGVNARIVPAFDGAPIEWIGVYHKDLGTVYLMRFDRGWFVREIGSPVGALVEGAFERRVTAFVSRARMSD